MTSNVMVNNADLRETKEERRAGKFISYFAIITIALSLFFEQYNSIIKGVTLGELLLIVACLFAVIQNQFKFSWKSVSIFWFYYILALALTLISILNSEKNFTLETQFDVITRWIRYLAYVLFISILCQNKILTNIKDDFIKVYKFLCIIISIYSILQLVFYLILHIYLPIKILPMEISRSITVEQIISQSDQYYFRAYGIFIEPSYLAKMLLPGFWLGLCGWGKEKKTSIFSTVLIAVAVIVSTSVQGIVMVAISFVLWLFLYNKIITGSKILLLIIMVFFVIIVITTGIADTPISRLKRLTGTDVDHSSGMRLFRGFAFFREMPFLFKIIGVGMGNTANFADAYNIVTEYDYGFMDANALQYMNGVSAVLVENGVICFVIFLLLCVRLWEKTNGIGRGVFVQWILILMSSSSLFSVCTVFYVFFIYLFSKKGKNN